MAPTSLSETIRGIARGLRNDALSHSSLNRAATRVDYVGRQLHGLDCVRDAEIAACLTAALRELSDSHPLPEEQRCEGAQRAVAQLHAAADHVDEGVRPTT